MKNLSQFVQEGLSEAQYEKFRNAINEYFQNLFDNAEDKNDFIELLRMQANPVSDEDFYDFLEEFTNTNDKYNFDKLKMDDEIGMIVKDVAQEWLDDIE